uniref:Ubiquitin-like protein ATG12 n=1 Tax=Panagrolaimus superbus TaxID=310955 RepID=A0A914XZP1_9BILA
MSTSDVPESPQPQQQESEQQSAATPATPNLSKITLLLKPVGDVPQLKTQKFAADGSRNVQWVISFLQKALKLDPSESIYIFVSQSFAPSPDHTLSNLHQCFSASPTSNLVLHYAKTCAWG